MHPWQKPQIAADRKSCEQECDKPGSPISHPPDTEVPESESPAAQYIRKPEHKQPLGDRGTGNPQQKALPGRAIRCSRNRDCNDPGRNPDCRWKSRTYNQRFDPACRPRRRVADSVTARRARSDHMTPEMRSRVMSWSRGSSTI